MRHPEFDWVGHKSNLDSPTRLDRIKDVPDYTSVEGYRSVYRFEESAKELASLATIPKDTKYMADHLWFDLDSKDLAESYADMQTLCTELEASGVEFVCYFSGGKGFHVGVQTEQFEFEPTDDDGVLARMAKSIADGLKLASWDSKIYNKSRVLRIPNSKHPKTKLHKVRVSWQSTLADIKQFAKNPHQEKEETKVYDTNDVLLQIYANAKVRVIRDVGPSINSSFAGVLEKPVQEGGRNDAAYRMAQYFARRATTEADAVFILRAWNAKQVAPPLSDEELVRTIRSAYSKGVNNLQDEGDIKSHVHDIHSAIEESRKALLSVGGGIVTGFADLDRYTMGFQPQDVIVWVARTRTYKTALASAFSQRISTIQKKPALLFSMEMPVASLNYRHMQYGEEMTRKEVYDAIKAGHEFKKTREAFKYVEVVGISNLTTARVCRLLDHYMEKHGGLSLVSFDYLSLFKDCASDTKATAKQITEIKTVISKMLPCPVLVLAQARRDFEGEDATHEVTLDGGKDAGYIEDSADYFFGAWNHRHSTEGGDQRLVFTRCLKARAYDSLAYPVDNPYFILDINAEQMNVQNLIHDPNPPKFSKRPSNGHK